MRSEMSVRREDSVQLTITRGYRGDETLPDRTLSSIDLFRGRREIAIEHAGSLYRLKITRQGKLILNK